MMTPRTCEASAMLHMVFNNPQYTERENDRLTDILALIWLAQQLLGRVVCSELTRGVNPRSAFSSRAAKLKFVRSR